MKIKHSILTIIFVASLTGVRVLAQTRPATTPATPTITSQTGLAIPPSKVAIIYSDLFMDPKTGITKFNSLLETLNREFQSRRTELDQLQQRIKTLSDEIDKTKSVAEPTALRQKADSLEQVKRESQRKGEDAQAAYDKRRQEIFLPLQLAIGKALEDFAKQEGITMIVDGSQVPVVYVLASTDVSRAFINYFNTRNPATASATTP